MTLSKDGLRDFTAPIITIPNSDKTSKIPYASIRGAAVGLLKMSFINLDGDQSDTSRPRLIVSQQAGNYFADLYYLLSQKRTS